MDQNGRARNGGTPGACRIRIRAGEDAASLVSAVRRACGEHAGPVPLFIHLLLPDQEVVIRARGQAVEPGPDFAAKIDALLGPAALVVEHAGRS